MTSFRMGTNGFFNDQVTDAEATGLFRNFVALRRDSYVDFNVMLKGHVPIEIIRAVRRLTGDDFADWMRVNAEGPLASLVRDILNYLNGKIGHMSLRTSITMHEERLRNFNHHHDAVYVTTSHGGSSIDPLIKQGLQLYHFDLYRLMAGIGTLDVSRIFLLLGGGTYYVEQ